MELIERIPLEKIKRLSKISYTVFKQYTGKCKTEKERKEYFEKFKSYCSGVIKMKGISKRIYHYTDKSALDAGRLFSGSSIQGIAGDFRGYLMNGITTDLDMKNCHPVILEYICKLHKFDCPILSYYNNNRAEILTRIEKTDILKAVNSDKINKSTSDEFLRSLDKECKVLQAKITALPEYQYIVRNVPETKLYNWMGSAINRILCVFENQILQVIVKHLTRKGIEICTLMFDGCLIYGNYYNTPELLRELEEFIVVETGINMKLSYKEHSENFVLDDMTEGEEEEETNDVDETKYLMKKYTHWVFCKGVLYCFDDKNGLWTTSQSVHKRIIMDYARGAYANTITRINTILSAIPSFCINDSWLQQNFNSSLGKLLFNNGYYDSVEQKFYDKFDPSIVFFHKIHLDFKEFDMEYMADIRQRLFFDPLGEEVGQYLMQTLSRGLMGEKMKRVLFGLGATGCGKSTITMAFSKSCGEYIGTFNASNLTTKDSADEAQAMRWALLLASKRLIFSNELDSKQVLNGTTLKKHSGNDELIGRTHGKEETAFQPHYLMMLFGNDMPMIKPYDDAVDKRVDCFGYTKQFVENPVDVDELKIDPNLCKEMDTIAFQLNFLGMLIHENKIYHHLGPMKKPEACLNAKKDWVSQEVGCLPAFFESFEITNDEADKVPSTEIDEWLKDSKLEISIKKLSIDLKKHTEKGGFDKVESKVVSIGGKKLRAWVGIKRL